VAGADDERAAATPAVDAAVRGEIVDAKDAMLDPVRVNVDDVARDEVGASLERLRVRQEYLRRLYAADSAMERLRVLFMANGPSRAWRFDKWVQSSTTAARIRIARRRDAPPAKPG